LINFLNNLKRKFDTFELDSHIRTVSISSLLIFQTIYLLNHHFWRDEAQAWLISRDAISFPDLLSKLEYEGHPPLWYLLIKILNYGLHDVNVLKILQGGTNLWFAFLLLTDKKLSTLKIIAILSSFYILIGYSSVSRPYMLGICLVYSAIRSFESKKHTYGVICFCLTVYTHILFFPIATALIVYYLTKTKSISFRTFSALFFMLSIFVNFEVIRLKPDSNFKLRFNFELLGIPIKFFNFLENIFNPLTFESFGQVTFLSILSGIFLISIFLFLKRIDGLLAFGFLGMIIIFFVNYLIGYQYAWWHFGVVYGSIMLYLRVGISELNEREASKSQITHFAGVMFFIISILSAQENFQERGYAMIRGENYSNSHLVADYIDKNCKDRCMVIQDKDYSGAAISALLNGKEIYYLNISKLGTYTIWNEHRNSSVDELSNRFKSLQINDCVLIKDPLSKVIYKNTALIFTTNGAIQDEEDFEVRRCKH